MKRFIKGSLVIILIVLVMFCITRFAVIKYLKRTNKNGINETKYVEINGSTQWISIYGKDKNNKVLLYLHGGPGGFTSQVDYKITRKWSDVYTIVTWDQRNNGKSYDSSKSYKYTYDLLMEDGKEITKYILKYLNKNKITILGHSWGSIYGANLVQAFPEYYDCFIGTGQYVDIDLNEKMFLSVAKEWAKDDEEGIKLINQIEPGVYDENYFEIVNDLLKRYGYNMYRDKTDYNDAATILFNPYYTIHDWFKSLNQDMSDYYEFVNSSEFKKFSLLKNYDYKVPYININGDCDYQANYLLAKEYYDKVNSNYKKYYLMENTTHGLLFTNSEDFSSIIHEIYDKVSNI